MADRQEGVAAKNFQVEASFFVEAATRDDAEDLVATWLDHEQMGGGSWSVTEVDDDLAGDELPAGGAGADERAAEPERAPVNVGGASVEARPSGSMCDDDEPVTPDTVFGV